MRDLAILGNFLLIALVLPGLIIVAACIALFPEFRVWFLTLNTFASVAIVFLVSFLNGHIPFLLERLFMTRVWDFTHRNFQLAARDKALGGRSKVLADADVYGVPRKHFDIVLANFILYYNTGFWLCVGASWAGFTSLGSGWLISILILIPSVVSIFVTAPLYKHKYIQVLESVQEGIEFSRSKVVSDSVNENSEEGAA